MQEGGFLSALLHATGHRRRSNVPYQFLPASQCVYVCPKGRRLVAADCLFAILYCNHVVIRTMEARSGPDYPGIRTTEGELHVTGNIQ